MVSNIYIKFIIIFIWKSVSNEDNIIPNTNVDLVQSWIFSII